MNDWDKNNYNFIMSLSPEEFDKWASGLEQDDVDYAIELIQQARQELSMLEAELVDNVEDLAEARNVLKQFTLKGHSK
jgi:hypothetical protein